MSDRERAKEWIDELSSQDVDRILYFISLCLIKRDLYYEKYELKKEKSKLKSQLQQKENIIKDIKAQLDYLETYSSKEDVYKDMSRRLNRIEKIIYDSKENK